VTRSSKKHHKKKSNDFNSLAGSKFVVSKLVITEDPIKNREVSKLPKRIQKEMDELYDLIFKSPHQALSRIKNLCEKYPHVPQFSNYLAVAYSNIYDWKMADKIIEENYTKNPNYLFARIHYGELCIKRKQFDKIPKIFDNKFDLKGLYPKRKKFHISEVVAFLGLIGYYFASIQQKEAAETCYKVLKQIDPTHSWSKRLKRKLYPSIFSRFIKRILHKS